MALLYSDLLNTEILLTLKLLFLLNYLYSYIYVRGDCVYRCQRFHDFTRNP